MDWDRLKDKIDCGADFVLTQLFFDNADFFRFRDHLRKKGVAVPICPGIIPILSAHQIKRFTALCGADLPAPLLASLEKYAEDDEACAEFGIEYATQAMRGTAARRRAGPALLHLEQGAIHRRRGAQSVLGRVSSGAPGVRHCLPPPIPTSHDPSPRADYHMHTPLCRHATGEPPEYAAPRAGRRLERNRLQRSFAHAAG